MLIYQIIFTPFLKLYFHQRTIMRNHVKHNSEDYMLYLLYCLIYYHLILIDIVVTNIYRGLVYAKYYHLLYISYFNSLQ